MPLATPLRLCPSVPVLSPGCLGQWPPTYPESRDFRSLQPFAFCQVGEFLKRKKRQDKSQANAHTNTSNWVLTKEQKQFNGGKMASSKHGARALGVQRQKYQNPNPNPETSPKPYTLVLVIVTLTRDHINTHTYYTKIRSTWTWA